MKHCRIAIKQLQSELPELQVTLLRQRTHFVYELRLGGAVRRLSISASPKNVDHAIENAVKEAKRLLGAAR